MAKENIVTKTIIKDVPERLIFLRDSMNIHNWRFITDIFEIDDPEVCEIDLDIRGKAYISKNVTADETSKSKVVGNVNGIDIKSTDAHDYGLSGRIFGR